MNSKESGDLCLSLIRAATILGGLWALSLMYN